MATNNESSIDNYHLKERRALLFLIVCVSLAALLFGLIHALMYLTTP